MGIRIQQLPADIANQIAAGEVVERPASVVKELLENAADAHARHIVVSIGYGGLNLIRVADDGSGIDADDLLLAVMAHATSKIRCLDDLSRIASMGFRGEALASIASVSQLRIESRPAQQAEAMCLERQNGQWHVHPCARAQGTTVEVTDLFANAPVRKRFLKSERSEFLVIEQVVKRFALARPDIGLQLLHNARLLLDLPAASQPLSQARRVQKLLGKRFFESARWLEVQRANMQLTGWISTAHYQRSQQDKQWIYVNCRMVRDKLLNHALKQAYEGQLHPGRHPACVLYLTMNPAEVDVNVHPTKHELRFQQPRLVHDFLMSSLRDALASQEQTESGAEVVRLKHSDPVRYLPQICSQPVTSVQEVTAPGMQATHIQWKQISPQFSLILEEKNVWIAQTEMFLQALLCWRLEQECLPWRGRPLLLPIPLPETLSAAQMKSWQALLARHGMEVQITAEAPVVLKTLPLLLPQLDIHRFMHALVKGEPDDAAYLRRVCSQYSKVEPKFSSEQLAQIQDFFSAQYEPLCQGGFPCIRRLDDTLCGRVLYE
ncbi:MAG: DNA mismatch repair endonuclease MutL [Legionellaceae bacterium]|nr:DNA mismatch repair endonuclease MutL [Legionellaceae bacterium]